MNSGCGINEGYVKVLFDDGLEYWYTSPGGELSGLTFGERRFNIVGKCNIKFILSVLLNPRKMYFFGSCL